MGSKAFSRCLYPRLGLPSRGRHFMGRGEECQQGIGLRQVGVLYPLVPSGADQEYNRAMRQADRPTLNAPEPAERPRHAGWAALVGVLGLVFVLIGAMLLAMLQAPVVRPKIIVTGAVLIAGGLVLLPVAWLGLRSSKP